MPERARRWVTLLAIWVPALVIGVLAFRHRCLVDDTFVGLRVADNLLRGHGPVFNPSERVEASTNTLWIALIALIGESAKPFVAGRPPLEWISVLLGIVGSAGGLAFAALGCRKLLHREDWLLPLGSLVVVGLSPFWDYTASGLETGPSLAWLGASFYAAAADPKGLVWPGVLIGLGPLIRPDLALEALAFLVVLLVVRPAWTDRVRLLIAAAAVPVAFEIFRMGYFAALVPNPALSKEAGLTCWKCGIHYLADFVEPYHLWFPLLLLAGAFAFLLTGGRRGVHRREILVAATPVAAGLLHGLYILRVGGDFMHARLLLPPLFAVLLPVTLVPGALAALTALLLSWTIASAGWFRCPYPNARPGFPQIENEHAIYASLADFPEAVTLEDFVPHHGWATDGLHLAELARERHGSEGLFSREYDQIVSAAFKPSLDADVIAYRRPVGITGYAAGDRVHICDAFGLGDPITARIQLPPGRPVQKIGHEKNLMPEWCVARYLEDGPTGHPPGISPGAIDAARAALRCGELRELIAAITEPLTLRRFWKNLWLSFRLTKLRIPADAVRAQREVCGQ